MHGFIEAAVSGVLLGGVYGLGALGMSLIFGVMGVLNLAHGAFMVLGGAVAWSVSRTLGAGPAAAIPAAVVVTVAAGLVLGRWGVAPPGGTAAYQGRGTDLPADLLVTLGCALVIEDLVIRFSSQGIFSLPMDPATVRVAGADIAAFKLVLLAVVMTCFWIFSRILKKTRFGKAVRACTQDRIGAVLMGACYRRTALAVFAAGSGLAGLAGAFFLMLYPLSAAMAIPLTVRALLVVVLGGMGRIFHTLAAAMLLGTAEVFTGYVASTQTQALVPYAAMVAVLLVRPSGIGGAGNRR